MSSQTRIDSYFKSTTSKLQSVKELNRSKSGHELLKKGPGRVRSFGNTSIKKKTWHTKNSTQEVSANHTVYLENVDKSPPHTLIKKGQLKTEDDSKSVVHVTTPIKKTIKGFAKSCNSPAVNCTQEKMSLKRQIQDSPTGSLKKSPVFHKNNITNDSEVHSMDDNNLSRLGRSRSSPNFREYFDRTSGQDIIEVTEENHSKSHSQEYNGETHIGPCDKELQNGNSLIKKGENKPNSQRNNSASQSNSEKMETKITEKKRKMRDSLASRNSPSSSGWKVAITIQTADVSMTALSSDWQKTLEASQELEKSSVIAQQRALKENVQATPGNEGNYENASEKLSSVIGNSNDAYSKKTSPRRALFPAGNSRKKVRLDGSVSATTIHTLSVENSVQSMRNEENTLPQGISESTNFGTNKNCNATAKINKRSNSKQQMAGLSNETTTCLLHVSPTKDTVITNLPTNVIAALSTPRNMAKTPIKVNATSSMPRNMPNSPTTATQPNESAFSPRKKNEAVTTPTKSPSRSSKSSFSPRFKLSPRKPPNERVDTYLATRAVENLNQTKQGIIPMNNFDLAMIYAKTTFEFEYGILNTNTATKYEAKDVQVPDEKHADHFFMVLVNVFSEALNCGYFNEEELDTVFSILTLSPDAQSLLARILKRKRGWHRASSIKYLEIRNDLTPVFKELVNHGFLDDDIASEDISKLLNILQVDEIKAVCQTMKRPKATKPAMISDLVKLGNKNTSLFPGMKSPSFALREKINATLGFCIRLPERIENLLNRIFILLIPNQDPKENMVEAFRMLVQVHFGEKIFPETPKDRFPIFRDRLHLIRYAKARSAYTQIINASEAKDWNTVRTLGQLAHDNLKPYFEISDSSDEAQYPNVPSHVKRYDPNYLWVKVMSKSVEGFKKTKEGMAIAAELLHTLVSSRNKVAANRTRWYNELAMIESYHRKNFETSAEITLKALMQEKISTIDAAEILERARKLCKSKAVCTKTKERIKVAVSLRQEMSVLTIEPTVKEIEATMVPGNTTGSKSTWSVKIGGLDTGYVRVENVALRHYLCEGFRSGIHCEGALPVTIFATVLWEEIYTVPVPGAFVSSYQEAPLDLYTSHFLEPRRERIEKKLNSIRRLNLESLSSIMHEDFLKYREYESLVHGKLFAEPDDFKDLIECLGTDAVVGICERLAGNYCQWKSGFPDLALWNSDTKKCKIVEVKGPGDSLSTKQKLWIQFLETLGVEVEVCVVKGTTKRYAT